MAPRFARSPYTVLSTSPARSRNPVHSRLTGSFGPIGTLFDNGSLVDRGTLDLHGSLIISGTLFEFGSLEMHGTLSRVAGSLWGSR